MSNLRGTSNPSGRGHSIFRGRPTGQRAKWSGRGRGTTDNPLSLAGGQKEATNSVRLRPTHFLALPLINHPGLLAQINTFQTGLFSSVDGLNDNFASLSTSSRRSKLTTVKSSLIAGLDSSILIDPRRLHMTLGVMTLEQQDDSLEMPTGPVSSINAPPQKTVSTALYFLNSLKPRISEILNGDKGVKVPLEVMHVLKTEKMWINTKEKTREARGKEEVHDRIRNGTNENASRGGPEVHDDDIQEKEAIGAGVLYVAPEIKNQSMNMDLLKLIQVSNFVHQAFKDAGYLTDTRPLKLHCTILNTSHRRPHSRQPFSYSDILTSRALRVFSENAGDSNSRSITSEKGSPSSIPEHEQDSSSSKLYMSTRQPNASSRSNPGSNMHIKSQMENAPSVPLNLGVYVVEEIQLWVMGSHGPNNEYSSCGGILLE